MPRRRKKKPPEDMVCEDCGKTTPRIRPNQVRCPECRATSGTRFVRLCAFHGITVTAAEEMHARQDGLCAECSEAGGLTDMIPDHDETCHPGMNGCTVCTRRLICRTCNRKTFRRRLQHDMPVEYAAWERGEGPWPLTPKRAAS